MKNLAFLLLIGCLLISTACACDGNGNRCTRLGIDIAPIESTNVFPKMPSDYGVLVTLISANSLAEKMRLTVGDIIQNVNGQDILTPIQLEQVMSSLKTGIDIQLRVYRNGKLKILSNTEK